MSYIEREKLIEILANYFNVNDDCYAYNLTRVKEAFAIGTVTIDDFVEFDDEVISDIADYILKNAPTEDVAPIKHGKWAIYEEADFDYEEPIFVNEDNLIDKSRQHHYLVTVPMCSICHSHALLDGGEEYVLSDYCSHCGAKMDGDKDE